MNVVTIVCSLSHVHFNYIEFIHIFEHFNELNCTVIVKIIMEVVASRNLTFLDLFLLRYRFTEQLSEI